MTQTVLTTVPTQHATNHPSIRAIGPMLALHGSDPLTGIPATWHVTSLADDGASGSFLIERAEGEIHSPALWMQARRDAQVGGEAEVVSLVRSVMFPSLATGTAPGTPPAPPTRPASPAGSP